MLPDGAGFIGLCQTLKERTGHSWMNYDRTMRKLSYPLYSLSLKKTSYGAKCCLLAAISGTSVGNLLYSVHRIRSRKRIHLDGKRL